MNIKELRKKGRQAYAATCAYDLDWVRMTDALYCFGKNNPVPRRFQEDVRFRPSIRPASIDLEAYLADYMKPGTPVDANRFSLWERQGPLGNSWGGHCIDAPYSFFLVAEMTQGLLPLAISSFDLAIGRASSGTHALKVMQIQALSKQDRQDERCIGEEGYAYLSAVKWERMLLHIIEDWARDAGFRQIRVQRAEDNGYYASFAHQPLRGRFTPEELRRNERLRMRYDVTARRSGYHEPTDERPYFWKDLRPSPQPSRQ